MLERHHIIFKSQLGLDFPLNFKYLTLQDHRGDKGPHRNRQTDLKYKRELEQNLRKVLVDPYYKEKEVAQLLNIGKQQAKKAFKVLEKTSKGIKTEDIIKRLLGGRYYL